MSTLVCSKGLATRIFALPLTLLCLAGFSATASAQSAPQLVPYTSIALAGSSATTNPAKNGACPVSGFTATDAYGDGCLATEIALVGPRYAAADSAGTVYFSDYTNGLIRRIDPATGVVTAVAGGVSTSPGVGAVCGSGTSIDVAGDGCPSTAVNLYHPTGLVFAPNGDLYFANSGEAQVRKIAATGGFITNGGIISLVDGSPAGTYGYTSNNASGNIIAATQSFLDGPYGLAMDAAGNLFISDEYKNAVLVVNTNTTGSTTVTGITIPAGTVAKIAGGYGPTAPVATCPNGSSGTYGCSYGTFTSPSTANSALLDSPYAVAVDPLGNVYFANEYLQNVGKITPAGILTQYVGTGSFTKAGTGRVPAGSTGIGSDFGLAVDPNSNLYVADAVNGVVWRVDGENQSQYVIAGNGTPCSAATDAFGDGCPALQATFGKTGSAYATVAAPGIFGVTIDKNSNLYVGDTQTNLIREISSGTQFGNVGANLTTNTLDIHFGVSDMEAAASAFTLTAGGSNFMVGTPVCTTNTDSTRDCLVPVTANPTAVGAFTGTLQVTSAKNKTSTFTLNGTLIKSPATRTAVTFSTGASCSGATTIGATTPVTLTAKITSTGTPTGKVKFLANDTQIGTDQPVAAGAASLTYTFATTGIYTITAVYSGDSYFTSSTGKLPTNITSSAPSFTSTPITTNIQSSVIAGQTALYSFTLSQSVYNGTITFACSGLPAYSSCVFSPPSISNSGCSMTSTIALSILTQQAARVNPAALAIPGSGPWQALGIIPGVLLALFVGIRRRKSPLRFGQVWLALALLISASSLVACGKNGLSAAPTPSFTGNVTVTATGSAGTVNTFTVPLTVK